MSSSSTKNPSTARSVWQVMATTPMRDILRGRATCRLDLTIYPERAGLPRALADLVVRVASRTRLRALEKADVARELSAHFAEGVAAGKSTDELIEDFGDVKQAVKLIRRAKKRNRSRIIRAMKRTTAVTFAVIAILYTGVILWYITGSGEVNPSHDYLADMNAIAAAIPEQDRAWPVYREAFLSMGKIPKAVRYCSGPADYRWPEAVAFIESHQNELDQIRQAASMPGLGYIVTGGYHEEDLPLFDPGGEPTRVGGEEDTAPYIPSLSYLLPHAGQLSKAVRLLRLDTLMRLESTSVDHAIGNIEAMIGLAFQSREHPILISQLISAAITRIAIDTTRQLMASPDVSLDDDDLARLDRIFDPSILGDPLVIDIVGERLILEDVEQHIYTDSGSGNGRVRVEIMAQVWTGRRTPLHIAAPTSALMPDRKTFRAKSDELYAAAERELAKPMWERDVSETQALIDRAEQSQWEKSRWSFLLLVAPVFDRTFANAEIAAMKRDALRTTIALHRYQLANNRWPATLNELIPDYLDALPVDRFDGQPLRYKLDSASEPILYSIGANRKDNGGVVALDRDGFPSNAKIGGWIAPSKMRAIRDGTYVDDRNEWTRKMSPIENLLPPDADFILWPPLPEKPVEPEPDPWE